MDNRELAATDALAQTLQFIAVYRQRIASITRNRTHIRSILALIHNLYTKPEDQQRILRKFLVGEYTFGERVK